MGRAVVTIEPFHDNILIHKAAKLDNVDDRMILFRNALGKIIRLTDLTKQKKFRNDTSYTFYFVDLEKRILHMYTIYY